MEKLNDLKIKIFNVGHGDCILIEFPNGELGLVDSQISSNTGCSPAFEYIRKKKQLKFLCLTHPHSDHFRGMMQILENNEIKVEKFYHSVDIGLHNALQFHNEFTFFKNSQQNFFSEYAKIYECNKQDELLRIYSYLLDKPYLHESLGERTNLDDIGGVKIMTLSPTNREKNSYNKKIIEFFKVDRPTIKEVKEVRDFANTLSIVFSIVYDNIKILLTGDALASNWKSIINRYSKSKEWLPVNIMKASHHGSKNSFYLGMWDSLLKNKSLIIISAGKPNHPSEEIIKDLRRNNHEILCTNKGNYCFKNSFISSDPKVNFYFESSSKEEDRTCCDWIEIQISPKSSQPIKYSTGHDNSHRHCLNCSF